MIESVRERDRMEIEKTSKKNIFSQVKHSSKLLTKNHEKGDMNETL